jgi:hypothetical protein
MIRYINIYPEYTSTTVYETYEAAREACGHDPRVKTIKLCDHAQNVIGEESNV